METNKISLQNKPKLFNYFKIYNFWIKAGLVFLFFFSLFLSLHLLNGHFTSSDDPYYHAKHALLIEQSGQLNLIKPWLEFQFFNYAPTDLWWGFHLGMALFIHFFGLFLGVEIFVSFLAALVFLVFYLVLSGLKIKYASVWTGLLFFSSTIFCYRLFLERPHLLSMIVFPLAIYYLIKNKNFWLFILSLIYILFYHLAPLIILLAGLYIAVDAYYKKQINLQPLIASAGGILAGIIIHPAGLNYLYVMFVVSFKIFFLKFSGVNLNIGGELQFISFFEFLKANFLVLCFYILAVVIFLSLKKRSSRPEISCFLFLYSSFWFVVSLLVPRGVEYWLPAVFLFVTFIFNDFIKTDEFYQIKHSLAGKINFKITGFFLISVLVLIIFNNLSNIYCDLYYNSAKELSANYEQANLWLKANSEKGSVIFYDNWSMWPMMFYYNDYNHYITGMDPTLLYEYDARTYWLWQNISAQGVYCDEPKLCLNISPREQIRLIPITIKTVFRAKYAVVSNYENSNLVKTLNNLKAEVRLVFKNNDLLIYEMK